ncbi:MAG TPA: terminase large subunit [Methanospirillum sp.]|nr:terminase large subunit [Methanospirillum sp.]
MQREIIDDLRYALDPVAFAREICKKPPDPWQAQLLMGTSKRILLNCSRQSGKSTTSAILALHRALFFPKSMIILVSHTQRQSDLLFKKVQEFYELVPNQPKLPEDNKRSMKLRNGSWIVSVPGKGENIRGYSAVDLLIEDEAAQVSDELYTAVLPMLATCNGKLMLMSTPYGKRGHFHTEWTGKGDWDRIKVTARECPRITDEFLNDQIQKMSEWEFKQEFLCEFGETLDSVFSFDLIQSVMDNTIEPLFPLSDYKLIIPGMGNDIEPLFKEETY